MSLTVVFEDCRFATHDLLESKPASHMTLRTTLPAVLLVSASFSLANAASLTPAATGAASVGAAVAGRSNHALASAGGVAFSSTDLTPDYAAARVNDGVVDHSGNSWIPSTTASSDFVAVKFGAAQTLGAVVFHGQTGYNGRSAGTWSVQYTKDAAPAAGSTWTEIGTYIYAEPSCAQPMPRSLFSFTPVAGVTAVRLVLLNSACGIQLAVQELEAYSPIALSPSVTGDAPVAGAIAGRPNLALASAGGVAFASSELTPDYGAGRVNDGVINHGGNSYIPATTASSEFVAVRWSVPADIDSLVFHGQTGYNGRSAGTWSLEYTKDAAPSASSAWANIGTYSYSEPGCAVPMPRTFFSFSAISNVTGVRLVLQNAACGIQLAVQELEAYGPLVSPPTIDTQPSGGSVVAGGDFTFTVAATGASTFQWRKNGNAIAGATASSFRISDVKVSDAGTYSVVVANSAGSVTSDNAALVVTPAPTFATYTEAVLNDNPIHYYPLDETSGTTAADLGSLATSGGTYTGGLTLGQASAATRLGTCVRFDGAEGSFVDLGLFHPGNSVTLEAWVNADLTASSTFKAIIARWDGSYEMDWNPTDVGNLVIRNDANAFGIVATAAPISRGQWHHMVSVFDAGTLTIYVDGVQGSSQTIGGVLQNAGPTPDRVLVGATRSGNFNWKGLIDEVAIYDSALTPAQIRAHFRASQPGPPSLTIQNAVIVSWPSFPPGYVLQCAGSVGGPFTNYTGSIFSEGSKLIAPVPIGPTQKFFQLFKP